LSEKSVVICLFGPDNARMISKMTIDTRKDDVPQILRNNSNKCLYKCDEDEPDGLAFFLYITGINTVQAMEDEDRNRRENHSKFKFNHFNHLKGLLWSLHPEKS